MISIVIPTYNHCNEFLKPCIESILQYTDMNQVEILVVANGCTDNTGEYLQSIQNSNIGYIWVDRPMGYTEAANKGMKAATGDYIVLMNNDVVLLTQPKNQWIELLLQPHVYRWIGLSGPVKAYWQCGYNRKSFIAFWLVMIKREVIDKIGYLDEIFSPGMCEDGDYCIRAQVAGFECAQVPCGEGTDFGTPLDDQSFPIYHRGSGAFNIAGYGNELLQKNASILKEKYGAPRISIVIPTYNHCDDLLKPCIESIEKYTHLDGLEIVVVANGCTDNTKEYLEQSVKDKYYITAIFEPEAIGYTKATNLGIKVAKATEYIILLNNDTELLPQQPNLWIDKLLKPFVDPTVGMSGPLMLHDDYSDIETIIFFCACIRKKIFDETGVLDEIYSPGGGEDIEFSARCYANGYRVVRVPEDVALQFTYTNIGDFPIWHKDNQTFKDIPIYTKQIVKINGLLNAKRFNKHIKLNLGSGGEHIKGYLSVDLNDQRAHVMMDATKLDFEDNSIEEILASHLFEHINPYKAGATLVHWFNKLKPGGKLIMELPDIEKICAAFGTAGKGERYGLLNCIYGSVNTEDNTDPSKITSPHLFGWYPEIMFDHLMGAGFRDIAFMDEQIKHPCINFRVEARRPLE